MLCAGNNVEFKRAKFTNLTHGLSNSSQSAVLTVWSSQRSRLLYAMIRVVSHLFGGHYLPTMGNAGLDNHQCFKENEEGMLKMLSSVVWFSTVCHKVSAESQESVTKDVKLEFELLQSWYTILTSPSRLLMKSTWRTLQMHASSFPTWRSTTRTNSGRHIVETIMQENTTDSRIAFTAPDVITCSTFRASSVITKLSEAY